MTSDTQKKALLLSFDLDPTLVPGTAPYHLEDIGWLEAVVAYHESTLVPFPTGGAIIEMPDRPLKIALAGDWGAQTVGATIVGELIAEEAPDYTIHLGDVYYAGDHFEHGIFAEQWPAGKLGTFCLDGNHDLYAGGAAYLETLANPKFAAQKGQPYFALRNKQFLIVGLDSARASTSLLYQEGLLDPIQLAWLTDLIANKGDRKVILLSHHDAFDLACLDSTESTGSKAVLYKPLLTQILGIADPFEALWCWAHVHSPIVWTETAGLSCRCVGHGGVPYLPFPGIPQEYGDEVVKPIWIETNTLVGTNRAPNGCYMLFLDATGIREQFIDETGKAPWAAGTFADFIH